MIKFAVFLFFPQTLLCEAELTNVLILEAKSLKYSVVIGKITTVDMSNPAVIVTTSKEDFPKKQKSFFNVTIKIEATIYAFDIEQSFAQQMPNLFLEEKNFLMGSTSPDLLKWNGPPIDESRIFLIGHSNPMVEDTGMRVCIGSLDITELDEMKREVGASVFSQVKYSNDWLMFNKNVFNK